MLSSYIKKICMKKEDNKNALFLIHSVWEELEDVKESLILNINPEERKQKSVLRFVFHDSQK